MPSVNFGSSDYLSYGDTSLFDALENFSFSVWGKFDQVTSDGNFFTKGSGTGNMISAWRDENGLSGATDVLTFWSEISDTSNIRVQSATGAMASADTWYHAAGTFSGQLHDNIARCYVDGVSGTTDVPDSNGLSNDMGSTSALRIGAGYDVGAGDLAYPCFWNAQLTASEIQALADGCSPLRIRPGNIIFFAPIGLVDDNMFGTETASPAGTPTVATGPPVEHPFRSVSRTLVAFPAAGAPPVAGELAAGSLALTGVGL